MTLQYMAIQRGKYPNNQLVAHWVARWLAMARTTAKQLQKLLEMKQGLVLACCTMLHVATAMAMGTVIKK